MTNFSFLSLSKGVSLTIRLIVLNDLLKCSHASFIDRYSLFIITKDKPFIKYFDWW